MISRETSLLSPSVTQLILCVMCLIAPTRSKAVEPLSGPMVGARNWRTTLETSKENDLNVERLFEADIPLPVRAGMMMPFATIRYLDQQSRLHHKFSQDQRFGIGFLHHSPEGDPAWRVDFTRIGRATDRPATSTRVIANLLKPFPAVKLRPSDDIRSWVGLNYLSRRTKPPVIIPEVAWHRLGSDGLLIDMIVPKHIYIGLVGELISFKFGATQDWINLQTEDKIEDWNLRRTSSMSIILSPSSKWMITTSVLHDLKAQRPTENVGAEISVRWTPGP